MFVNPFTCVILLWSTCIRLPAMYIDMLNICSIVKKITHSLNVILSNVSLDSSSVVSVDAYTRIAIIYLYPKGITLINI